MRYFLSVVILLMSILPVYSFTDQLTVERILKENKRFIEFINVCISNFGEKENEEFFKVYQLHFNAEVAKLQSEYPRAFKILYKSQKFNADLYNKILTDYYLEDSKLLLDKLAPFIIRSKNKTARLYLTLAYRDRSISRNLQKVGNASHPRLFSYKIYKYLDAIKVVRRSIRYGLLSLFESQNAVIKKEIYYNMLKLEKDSGSIFFNRFVNKTDEEIINEINRDYKSYDIEIKKSIRQAKAKDKSTIEKTEENKKLEKSESDSKVKESDNINQYTFEKNVERSVRFKNEKRVAIYLRDADFYQADDIIRKYVEDYNFKIIQSTINYFTNKNEKKMNVDWEKLRQHHVDNYSRIDKNSTLNDFIAKVKVEDDIDMQKNDKSLEKSETSEESDKTENVENNKKSENSLDKKEEIDDKSKKTDEKKETE